MKKFGAQYAVFLLAILAFAPATHAATQVDAATQAEASQTKPVVAPATTPAAPAIPDTLSGRRDKAVTDLSAATTTLDVIAQKISTTLIRLQKNDIDTASAQTSLIDAQTKILDATVTLGTLGKAFVTDDGKTHAADTPVLGEDAIKESVAHIETDLLTARQKLIDSLTNLKGVLAKLTQ